MPTSKVSAWKSSSSISAFWWPFTATASAIVYYLQQINHVNEVTQQQPTTEVYMIRTIRVREWKIQPHQPIFTIIFNVSLFLSCSISNSILNKIRGICLCWSQATAITSDLLVVLLQEHLHQQTLDVFRRYEIVICVYQNKKARAKRRLPERRRRLIGWLIE